MNISIVFFLIIFSMSLLFKTDAILAQMAFWESTNGPFGGEIYSVAFQSTGRVFVGTSGSGVFRSIGTSDTWQPVTSGLPNDPGSALLAAVRALAVNSSDWVFAGTDAGVYVSSDGGDIWMPTTLAGKDTSISLLFIDSTDRIFANLFGKLYRSSDNGNTWQQSTAAPFGISSFVENSQGYIFAENSEGVHLSTDGGDNWEQTALTIPNISSLTIDTQDYIFAGIHSEYGADTAGVYRSTDNGSSWSLFDVGLDSLYSVELLKAAPNNQLYAGVYATMDRGGVYRSTDSGLTWEKINHGLADSLNLRSIATNTAGDVFAGTEHGLFRSINNGNNWHLFGVPGSFIASISFVKQIVFAETFWEFDQGILFRSPNNGGTWERTNDGIENTIVGDIIEIPSGDLLCGSLNGIFRSTNEGTSWEPDTLSGYIVGTLKFNSAGQLFAGTNMGMHRSIDNGGSWSPSGLPNEDIRRFELNSNDHLFAVSASNGIFRSTNNGSSWSPVGGGITTNSISDITINTNDYIFAATSDGVFRSVDNGNSWSAINNGLPNPGSVLHLSVDSLGLVFVGSLGQGVFKSVDNGDNWTEINDGLVNPNIITLVTSPDRFLFAGTFGNGVFRSSVPTGMFNYSYSDHQITFILEQNYPNPFNPETTIHYELPKTSKVVLRIYNTLGQEVRKLVNERQPAGAYQMSWDGRDEGGKQVSSGIYFYQLKAGNSFLETKKMVLMR